VRLDAQPFVVAGDTYLYRQGDSITVARLTTAGSSEYLVARERLQIDSNALTQDIRECETRGGASADACYNAAARSNQVVLPTAYSFWDSEYSTVAASEWGVHWADVSELSVLTGSWEMCSATGRLAIQITSAWGELSAARRAACMAERHAWQSGMHGRAACMAERHAWQSGESGESGMHSGESGMHGRAARAARAA